VAALALGEDPGVTTGGLDDAGRPRCVQWHVNNLWQRQPWAAEPFAVRTRATTAMAVYIFEHVPVEVDT
jgi:hypothetical protein